MNCLQIVVLAAVLTTALGVPVKRQSENECLYQYVTQPLNFAYSVCNPFTPDKNSLTLECSILVRDSREGELTIDWVHRSGISTEIIASNTTVTSPGRIITSTITVPTTRPGMYYCQPNSTQAGLLQISSQVIIASQAVYFSTGTSCQGRSQSSEQPQCILWENSTTTNESATTAFEATTERTTRTLSTETTTITNMNIPTTSNLGRVAIAVALVITGATILFVVIIVICVVQCFHRRRKTNRSKVPHSQGKGSRIVTEWHAINRNKGSTRYGQVKRNSPAQAPSTNPPMRAVSSRESKLTSSGYVDANPLLRGVHYTYTTGLQHNDQADEIHRNLQSSYTNAENLYANYQPPHCQIRVESIQEEGENELANTEQTMSNKDIQSNNSVEATYCVVGSNTDTAIYQGLIPETIDYISLYHTVNKN